ncbi:MAG: hypothetical protein ACO37D_07065 [Rhodothermales bacterium]
MKYWCVSPTGAALGFFCFSTCEILVTCFSMQLGQRFWEAFFRMYRVPQNRQVAGLFNTSSLVISRSIRRTCFWRSFWRSYRHSCEQVILDRAAFMKNDFPQTTQDRSSVYALLERCD